MPLMKRTVFRNGDTISDLNTAELNRLFTILGRHQSLL